MATEDYAFYEDQRTEHKHRCVNNVLPLTSSDLKFSHHVQPLSHPTSTYALSSSEQHYSFISILIVIQIVLHHSHLNKKFLHHKIAT